MEIKVFWTNFARKELQRIFNYYKKKASLDIARNIIEGIFERGNSLGYQTKIGQKEELLLDREEEFRYLVYKSYKIIYWFNQEKNRIEIVDVFDTRQYPEKLKRNK